MNLGSTLPGQSGTATCRPIPSRTEFGGCGAQAIAACDGDLRATIRALIVANEFLEAQISHGYRRGVRHGKFSTYSG